MRRRPFWRVTPATTGSINWRKVAGENDAVHDHWVEGIGDDVLLDFSNQDGDKIVLRGHTVEIASITYGEDDDGDYSLISIRSQQGDGGGAHDEDPLGTLKVYGDKVTADDIKVQAAGVFDGIDIFEPIADAPQALDRHQRVRNPERHRLRGITFTAVMAMMWSWPATGTISPLAKVVATFCWAAVAMTGSKAAGAMTR